MRKIKKALFIVCLVFVLVFGTFIVYSFCTPYSFIGEYSYNKTSNNGKIKTEYSYYFGLDKHLILEADVEGVNDLNAIVDIETAERYIFKVKNNSIYIDLNSVQVYNDVTDKWESDSSSDDPNWIPAFDKSDINAFWLTIGHGEDLEVAVNPAMCCSVLVMTVMWIIFFVKMIIALKGRVVLDKDGLNPNSNTQSTPLVRYDTVTGKPYEVQPTGFDPISGLPVYAPQTNKKKRTYGWLAIFLGFVGIQYFYAGKLAKGICSILFCWTGIPEIIGFMTGIFALCSTQEEFTKKYLKA